MPITAARRMYSATAVRPIPTDWAITRALAPQAYFRRRTSRTFRIDNLSAGIGPPPAGSQREDLAPFRLPTTEPASPYPQGGRLRSESVAAFARIGWPLSVGISGRLGSDSADPWALPSGETWPPLLALEPLPKVNVEHVEIVRVVVVELRLDLLVLAGP